MSKWKYVHKKDIELDDDELNIRVGEDFEGNNYVILKVADVLNVLMEEE